MWIKVWTTDLGVIVHAQRIGAQDLGGFVDNVDNLFCLGLSLYIYMRMILM
jgi:hypothetical protein